MILLIYFLSWFLPGSQDDIRIFEYQGSKVRTTYKVEDHFLGTYSGRKSGYLELYKSGLGVYKYDVFGFALKGCTANAIKFEWGFLVDDDNEIVKFKRDYGFSYPILMRSISENSFKGCREEIMLDFIFEKEGNLHVSSSDDWKKEL